MICFKNGQQIDCIPVMDRAFHYGDGCFSTARFHQNVFQLETLHLARLKLSAERLFLKVDFEDLQRSLDALQQQFAVLNGTLKIILSRGEGTRGYALPEHAADIYVLYEPGPVVEFQPVLIQSGVLQQAIGLNMPGLVGIKTLNRLEQVLLKKEAQQRQWSEALVTDVQGAVVEGISSNCFIRINDGWVTPELRYNGVHGVMRAEILNRMQQHNVVCIQRFVDFDEIKNIQALFFCNALNPMKIVRQLDERLLDAQTCIELSETLQLNQLTAHA
ncbi:aminodeoxychorismate lyase [Acinetobacter sp. WZC-1]|uniref:aminodeoxychorismate lyase n=1 Tax=Acinetobacter sp. WZC-1 TaxID=3459034 RepID=UPI00403D6A0F